MLGLRRLSGLRRSERSRGRKGGAKGGESGREPASAVRRRTGRVDGNFGKYWFFLEKRVVLGAVFAYRSTEREEPPFRDEEKKNFFENFFASFDGVEEEGGADESAVNTRFRFF